MGEEMMKVHFVLHETFEVPGAYLKWAQERGHQVTTTKVYERTKPYQRQWMRLTS